MLLVTSDSYITGQRPGPRKNFTELSSEGLHLTLLTVSAEDYSDEDYCQLQTRFDMYNYTSTGFYLPYNSSIM
jgi:hypothetical protein